MTPSQVRRTCHWRLAPARTEPPFHERSDNKSGTYIIYDIYIYICDMYDLWYNIYICRFIGYICIYYHTMELNVDSFWRFSHQNGGLTSWSDAWTIKHGAWSNGYCGGYWVYPSAMAAMGRCYWENDDQPVDSGVGFVWKLPFYRTISWSIIMFPNKN